MRVPPQVSDRIKEAPAQALRGVFAGIGQLLLITDKLRNKTTAQVPQARGPQPAQPRPEPVPPAPPPAQARPAAAAPPAASPAADRLTEARDLDKTRNVRLLTSEEARAGSTAPTVDAMTPVSEGVPLPNYDELSVASLRARLRNLDAAQVKQLAEYERAHADRADVIAMFERRIAKLEAEASEDADTRGEAKAEAEVEAREEVAAEVRAEVVAEAAGEA